MNDSSVIGSETSRQHFLTEEHSVDSVCVRHDTDMESQAFGGRWFNLSPSISLLIEITTIKGHVDMSD